MRYAQAMYRMVAFFTLILCSYHHIHSQELEIKEIAFLGDDVVISYDLLDNDVTHRYQLSLYSSHDNYILPLEQVEGDIGVDLTVGGNKQIIWHPRLEFGDDFKGDVAIELKGKLYIPFVTLNDFENVTVMKRDRPYTLTWAAGRGSNVLTWDLYNDRDERVHTFNNIANVGEYEFVIPKDIKPGRGYKLRITDQNNKEDIVITPPFEVKRKVPIYVPSGVATVAAGLIIYLINNLETATSAPDPISDLPCNDPDCN